MWGFNAVLLGGNWNDTSNSGSRCSNWNNAASNSNSNIGSRFACDNYLSAPAASRRAGPAIPSGQPAMPSFGKYIKRFREPPITENGKARLTIMGKRNRNLFEKVVAWENLVEAYRKTSDGKRRSFGYLEFKEYDLLNLRDLQQELIEGLYRRGSYREFTVYEPKPRLIFALDFRDRLVQHALCNVIAPIFDKTLLPYTFACREKKGTHAGVKHIQKLLRSTGCKYFLKTDFSKYFPSVDRSVLRLMIKKKIHCARTLDLIEGIMHHESPGIPIGSLTSQLFANVYGNVLDQYIHHELGQRNWARYMDDVVLLGDDLGVLHSTFIKIRQFSLDLMKMTISKWQVSPISKGINFLGYRIWPTHKLLRKDSVIRAKRKVHNFIRHDDREGLNKFLASWGGHAKWADAHNLLTRMEIKHA